MRSWWDLHCNRPMDFYSAISLKQQSVDRHVTPLNYPDSDPTSLCSFSLMLHALRRSNKYQFYSFWFDRIRARSHDLESRDANHYTNQNITSDSHVKNWQLRNWSKQYKWLSCEKLTAGDLMKAIQVILMWKLYCWGFDQSKISDSHVETLLLGIWSEHGKWFSCEKLTAGDLIKAWYVILMWQIDNCGFDQSNRSDSHVKIWHLGIWSKQ